MGKAQKHIRGHPQRLKEKIQPKGRNQRKKYKSDLGHFRQTTESFSEFWTELKRKFELA